MIGGKGGFAERKAFARGGPSLPSKGGGRINGAMTLNLTSVFQLKVRPPPFGSTRRMGHPCESSRVNADGAVDLSDFAAFQSALIE